MEFKEWGPKDWLRCNNCFTLMRQFKVPFSLSFCGHIFCSKCIQTATKNCPQCHTQNIRMMPLVEPLNPEVKHCFESMENLFEKLSQAALFQNQQLALNCNRLFDIDKKYTRVKMEYQRRVDDNKNLQKRIRELEAEMELSKRKISQIQNSTAMMTPRSNISSLRAESISSFDMSSDDNLYSRPKSYHKSKLVPKDNLEMDLNSEFRIPTMTKIPRSVGGSSKTSSNSSKGTPFSNFNFFNRRR